jgi:hypothetical protein
MVMMMMMMRRRRRRKRRRSLMMMTITLTTVSDRSDSSQWQIINLKKNYYRYFWVKISAFR